MIYFLRAGDQVKIGYAAKEAAVRSRATTIRANSPVAVELLGVIDGTLADEQALHARFAEHRLHSEWFVAVPEILALAETARSIKLGPAHGARLSFRCSRELVARVDVARGPMPRETWLRMAMLRAVEQALGNDTRAGAEPSRGGVEGHRTRNHPSPTGTASARGASESPAPAEPYVPPFRVPPAEPAPTVCPRHPDAGFTRVKGSSKLWCAESGCSASFEEEA